MTNKVAVYQPMKMSSPDSFTDIWIVYDWIRNEQFKEDTKAILTKHEDAIKDGFNTVSKDPYQGDKRRRLHGVCFAGEVRRASDAPPLQPEKLSGRAVCDIDKNNAESLRYFRSSVVPGLSFVEACGYSISGRINGSLWLTARYEVPNSIEELPQEIKETVSSNQWCEDLYELFYAFIAEKLNAEHSIDMAETAGVKTMRYLSADPDLYLNEEAVPITLGELAADLRKYSSFDTSSRQMPVGKHKKSSSGNHVVPEGERNDFLCKQAGKLKRKGNDYYTILAELMRLNDEHCNPPESTDKVEEIAKWVITKNNDQLRSPASVHDVGVIAPDEALELFDGNFSLVVGGKPFAIDSDYNRYSLRDGKDAFRNLTVEIPGEKKPTFKNAFEYWWGNTQQRYIRLVFKPGLEPDSRELNLWHGFEFEPHSHGNCDTFMDHLFRNVCQGDEAHYDFLLDWMAHLVQKPYEKIGIVLALRGKQASGKSIVGELIGRLISRRHFLRVDSIQQLTSRFNADFADKLLVLADEAVWGGDKKQESSLKNLITASSLTVEPKGFERFSVDSYMRFVLTSNENWLAPISLNDRRYFVLDVGDDNRNDRSFFGQMMDEMENQNGFERLLHILATRDISVRNWGQIPMTEAKAENIERSLDSFYQWLFESLLYGTESTDTNDLFYGCSSCEDLCVPAESVRSSYRGFCDYWDVRHRYDAAQFGKELSKVLGVRTVRKRTRPSNKRENHYNIPDITTCRKRFEQETAIRFADFEGFLDEDEEELEDTDAYENEENVGSHRAVNRNGGVWKCI